MSSTYPDTETQTAADAEIAAYLAELQQKGVKVWKPQPGPQILFHSSPADEALYGGAAGGGKSESLLVEAARYVDRPGHHAVLFRRTFPELTRADGLIPRSKQLFWGMGTWRQAEFRWYFKTSDSQDPATIDFSHLERPDDVFAHQSAGYTYIGFDELTSFLEEMYIYLMSRGRSTRGIPIRYRSATNPGNEGHAWVFARWAAWLDPSHPNPAKPGELRYYARIHDEDREVEQSWRGPNGESPLSRTFIPAFVTDNPALLAKDPAYLSRLESLPEPYRSQLRWGSWLIGKENEWQVIPYAWVRAAMDRWHPDGGRGFEIDSVACDPARGVDKAVIGHKRGPWVAPLDYHQERDTMYLVGLLRKITRGTGVPAKVDIIGVGAGVYDRMREMSARDREDLEHLENVVDAYPINSSEKSLYTDSSGQLEFVNLRAYLWWHMRDLLDPANPCRLSDPIALPPDKILLSDLTSPRWRMTSSGIIVESKQDIKKRISRSTDAGDTVVMLFHDIGRSGQGRGGIWL